VLGVRKTVGGGGLNPVNPLPPAIQTVCVLTVLTEVPDVPSSTSADREVELADWSKADEDNRMNNRFLFLTLSQKTIHFYFLNSSVKHWPISVIFDTQH